MAPKRLLPTRQWSDSLSLGDKEAEGAIGRSKELAHIRPYKNRKPCLLVSEGTTRWPFWDSLALPLTQLGLESQLSNILAIGPWANTFSKSQFSLPTNRENGRYVF